MVIPARSGSKRIPNKNIKNFLGKPIICRVINEIRDSGVAERIIVSTDSAEIKKIAEEAGALVPFMRPTELSDDFSDTSSVMAHASKYMREFLGSDDPIMCVYPTAVMLTAEDLKAGVREFQSGKWAYVFSGYQPSSSPLRMFRLQEGGGCEMFFPNYFSYRSQDLPPAYSDAGMFYLAAQETWEKGKDIFGSESTVVEISKERAIDINDLSDWMLAESRYSICYEKGQ